VVIICVSYSQIIALFSSGRAAGYLVGQPAALGRTAGVVSGSALLIDYVLTSPFRWPSGMDALFSFLPESWLAWKLAAAGGRHPVLTLLEPARRARVVLLLGARVFGVFLHHAYFRCALRVRNPMRVRWSRCGGHGQGRAGASAEVGVFGVIAIGCCAPTAWVRVTYTGIEAVSQRVAILREPRVRTGRRTMVLMAISLGGMVAGLLVAYLLLGGGQSRARPSTPCCSSNSRPAGRCGLGVDL